MQENQIADGLARTLRELRKAHGYRQSDIAGAIGIYQATYSNYENGNRVPNTTTLYHIANFYGMSLDDILKMGGPLDQEIYYDAPNPSQEVREQSDFIDYINNTQPKSLSRDEKDLIFHFSRLSPKEQQEILDYIHFKYQRGCRPKETS